MNKVYMYCKDSCPFCTRAEILLKDYGFQITKIQIDQNPEEKTRMIEKTNLYTVPQIFINDIHIGGYDDLKSLSDSGKLFSLLHDNDS
ncbi:MAG: glutaredoxin 3 [Bordetella sp.]|nr:MAG: glutaredoxin 3 [Bordetella sp.]